MENFLVKWEPIENLFHFQHLETINDKDELIIILKSSLKTEKLKIIFDCDIISYQKIEKMYDEDIQKNNQSSLEAWPLFKQENSEYILWLGRSSCGIARKEDAIHIHIQTSSHTIDVITYDLPHVSII